MNKYWYLNTEKITELPEHAKSQRKYDLPYYDDWPKIKYIICSSPRCGSNLLSEILHAQDGLGVPIAYLHLPAHFPFLAHRWNCLNDNYVDIHKYFKSCFRWRTSKNGVFGMKTHWNHFEYFLKSGILHYYFPNTKFVFLRRQDLLGQAISLELANQTGQWTSKGSSHQKEPIYSTISIRKRMQGILQENANWRYFFSESDLNWIEVMYEDLCKDPSGTLQKVCSYIVPELKLQTNVDLNNLPLTIQRGHINKEWRERFLQELGNWRFDSSIN